MLELGKQRPARSARTYDSGHYARSGSSISARALAVSLDPSRGGAGCGVGVRENALLGWGILWVWSLQDPEEEGTSEVDAHSTRNVRVEAGGTQVPGHVGFHALGVVR